jgi:hypothetical protein
MVDDAPQDPQPVVVPDEDAAEVPLMFHIPVGLAGRYAHHLIVQGSDQEVTLSFFEALAPILLGTPEEQRATLEKGVRAECVARIIISKKRYPEFLKVMQGLLDAEAQVKASKK